MKSQDKERADTNGLMDFLYEYPQKGVAIVIPPVYNGGK